MLLYFLIIAAIVEISASILYATGLKKNIARYQSISMLTNTGFTTDEAKLIIDHPVRRKISAFLILFGAFSLAVIISILSTYLSKDIRIKETAMIVLMTGILLSILKTRFIQGKMKEKFSSSMESQYAIDELPIKDALYMNEDDFFTDIPLSKESALLEKNCPDMFTDRQDVQLLFIKRGTEVIRLGLENEKLHEGDILFVLGKKKHIEDYFEAELKAKASE